jgi:hypothetical protein
LEYAPFSTIQHLATATYSNNPSLCEGDQLAQETLTKHRLATIYGYTPGQIDGMDSVDLELMQTVLDVKQHIAEADAKNKGKTSKSMLPEGMVFQETPP